MSKKRKKKEMLDTSSIAETIASQYGDEALLRLEGEAKRIPSISSGNLYLDWALGTNGFPVGRMVEIFGPESSGKTTLALHTIASVQKKGGWGGFVDAEQSFDPRYAHNLGVDTKSIVVAKPDFGEEAIDQVLTMLDNSPGKGVVVLDSAGSLMTSKELEESAEKERIGTQARLVTKAAKKFVAKLKNSDCALLILNQIRMKIGVLYGNPETTPGGHALKHFCTQRVAVRHIGFITVGSKKEKIGIRARARVVKNKVAVPYNTAEFDVIFGSGVDEEKAFVECAVKTGVVKKRKRTYVYKKRASVDLYEFYKLLGKKRRKKIREEIRSL